MSTLNVRGIDAGAVEKAKASAALRGWTVGRYFAALVELHEVAREYADLHPEATGLRERLCELGLETRSG